MTPATAQGSTRVLGPAQRRPQPQPEQQRAPGARPSVKPFLLALVAAAALAAGMLAVPAGEEPVPDVVKIAPGASAAQVADDRAQRARHDRSRIPDPR